MRDAARRQAADSRQTSSPRITWRIREPQPRPLGITLLGLSMLAFATLPFALLAAAAADAMANPAAARLGLAGLLMGEQPDFPILLIDLLRTWVFVTPFFAGFIIRAAVPLVYPRCEKWLPPMIVRIGIYLAILTCAAMALLLMLAMPAIGVGAAFALLPLLIGAQLHTVLRVPQLDRTSAELERVHL